LISILVLSCSYSVYAGGYAGYKDIAIVHQRECSTDKGFEITLTEAHKNPDQCTNTLTIDLPCTHQAFSSVVSMVLAAKLAGKKMDFWLAGCGADGQAKIVTAKIQ